MSARGEFYKSFGVRIVVPRQETAREAEEESEESHRELMERMFGDDRPRQGNPPGPKSMIAQILPDGSFV